MRPRTSQAAKNQAGTLRPGRQRTALVPALTDLPPAPLALSEPGRAAWKAFGALAMKLGTLSEFDVASLELLARSWASCLELEDVLRTDGPILESGRAKKAHPALQALSQSRALCQKLLADFGLSPVGRERITIDPSHDVPVDPSEKYFGHG